jgi:NAD-dependent SIR2 family protein deacetylase
LHLRAINPFLADLLDDAQQRKRQKQQPQEATIQLEVGNTASPSSRGPDLTDWTLFVRPRSPSLIRSVRFSLHPTFRDNDILITQPPFELRRSGWGVFNVDIVVTDIHNNTHKLQHYLEFAGGGTQSVLALNISISDSPHGQPKMDEKPDLQEMEGVEESLMHGRLGVQKGWKPPHMVTHCDVEARPGYQSMQAHEYVEQEETLHDKIRVLADLLRRAKHCVAYTGAGISTSSGIDDYASKAASSVATGSRAIGRVKKKSGLQADPTFAHFTLSALHDQGMLHEWVQQNHDGLPQKAGFPQHRLNEIHGAWFNPSNPVVPMSGSLRTDLLDRLVESTKKADLVIAMGTSLCGMNADRMVEVPSKRAKKGRGLGSVIIGYQQTQMDHLCSLRIFENIDKVMLLLALELELPVSVRPYQPKIPFENTIPKKPHVFKVPHYSSKTGQRLDKPDPSSQLDLSLGAKLKLTGGPGAGFHGTVVGLPHPSQGKLSYTAKFPCNREGDKHFGKTLVNYALGVWYLQTACDGLETELPVVNY